MKISRKEVIQFVAFVVIILIATGVKEWIDRSKDSELSQFEAYLFIDQVGVLHTSSTCKGIKPSGSAEQVSLNSVTKIHLQKICSRCVNEEQLEELEKKVGY